MPGHPPAPGYGPVPYGYPAGVSFAPVAEYTRPGGRDLAQPSHRLAARIIDSLIVSTPVLLIEIPLMIWLYVWFFGRIEAANTASRSLVDTASEPAPGVSGDDVLMFVGLLLALVVGATLLSALITYLYDVIYMHRHGQTIGKRLMKLRVVRVEDGGPIEIRHARKRWMAQDGMVLLTLIPLVGSAVGIYNWVDSLWLLWDKPNRQCLHDKYGKTVVVKLTDADLVPGVAA